MHRTLMVLALAAMAGALGGCGLFQDVQTISKDLAKDTSDKDDIAGGATLTVPPDVSLRPPTTGTTAQSGDPTSRRAQVILRTTEEPATRTTATTSPRGNVREAGPTAGERELLTRSGHTGSTSDVVRRTVDIERERRDTGQKDFTDRVLRYDPKAKPASGEDKNSRDATGDKPVIKRPGEF